MGSAASIADDGALKVSNLFEKIDMDCNQSLSKYELRRLCEMNPDAPAVAFLNELIGADEDGNISLEEWKAAFEKELAKGEAETVAVFDSCDQLATVLWDERTADVFSQMDLDNNGGISKSELTRLCITVGYKNAKVVLDGMFDMFDADSDGQITKTEWKAMFDKELSICVANGTGTLAWFEELVTLWKWTKTTNLVGL